MEKFISIVKMLKKNWGLSLNIPCGYFEIDNKKTGKTIGLSDDKRREYLHIYLEKVKEIEAYMHDKIKALDAWHYNKEYVRQCNRLSTQMLLIAYNDGVLHPWGGPREGAGRPATGRKRRQYYLDNSEDIKVKQYIQELRNRD